jgi:hypothetical protein
MACKAQHLLVAFHENIRLTLAVKAYTGASLFCPTVRDKEKKRFIKLTPTHNRRLDKS